MLGDVFEHTRWIAERAYERRPFESVDAPAEAMVHVVKESRRHEQLTLLRAHPKLAGKEAQAGTLTASSTARQAGAGLTALSRGEMAFHLPGQLIL
jgi:2-oxo-4-hydroxy-4-carboxy-5-ureidoimidazoline decarboxylase